MILKRTICLRSTWPQLVGIILAASLPVMAQAPAGGSANQAVLTEIEGTVEVSRAGSPLWDPARTGQPLLPGDRVRTGDRSRAVVRLSDKTVLRKGPQTIVEIPQASGGGIRLLKGILYYFHRDRPRDFPVITPACYAAVVGTEFNVAVAENGATTLRMLDGAVELTNQLGQVRLQSGEAGLAEPGAVPQRTAVIEAVNAIQWCLYYPGVLHLDELALTAAEQQTLAQSLQAYLDGDLPRALSAYPTGRQPVSDSEKVYRATLLLAVGEVELAQQSLSELKGLIESNARLAAALRKLIAAVKLESGPSTLNLQLSTTLATEWLAESFHTQARFDLEGALTAARKALGVSTNFAFAWVRVAELEFSFGRIRQARAALARGLELAPRHAQGHALQGFFLAADNRTKAAIQAFNHAITLDGALGNAWLGRGLCRIRQGDAPGGLQDLQVAVVLEPQRAALRSYLGKAASQAGDPGRAARELALAKKLDDADPTAWLYSALLNEQLNRVNQAVHDLEQSQVLNDNRGVYRSRLLLDQDRAVRGANLARLYADAGMVDVSVREASRAVYSDYANFSAHLFLASSFDALRDPRQVNLRYETPWLSEFLLANLLAPVGAGALSPYVTQQEYSKLFERDRLGLVSSTEYSSNGDWIQTASLFGAFANTGFALDAGYRSENGQRPNNDFRQLTASLSLKHQLSPQDSLFFQAAGYGSEGGDVNQYYDPRSANLGLRMEEAQEPFLVAGYHRAWGPGMHTLLLAGRVPDRLRVENPQQETLLFQRDAADDIVAVLPFFIEQTYRSDLELYTAELQQIAQREMGAWIVGGRVQTGDFDVQNRHANADIQAIGDPGAGLYETLIDANQTNVLRNISPAMDRLAVYSYLYWRPMEPLLLIGGVSYDYLKWPVNFRYAPLSDEEEDTDQVSPKAGLIWTPTKSTTLRAAYAQALGGVSLDQSFQLEPTQVAGFVQTYRSLIPESVEGANAAPTFETCAVSIEQKFGGGTYLGLAGERLKSEVERVVGVYDVDDSFAISTSITPKELDYEERNLTFAVNQLLGAEWSAGARYRVSQAELDGQFTDFPSQAGALLGGLQRRTREQSTLHQTSLFVLFNHPSGFFAQGQALWTVQHNDGFPSTVGDEDFWQFNALTGWRLFGRRLEVTAGVLNLSDRDYRLHPLNLTAQLPRERTFVARLRFHF